jgi:hypothetical protein
MKKYLLVISFLFFTIISAQQAAIPFYPNGTYDSSIPAPGDVLDIEIGERPTRYHETVSYIKVLAEKSPLVNIYEQGETHQGRKLYYLTVTSAGNNSDIEKIKNNLSKLSDTRKLSSDSEANDIISSSPAVAVMMYSIHGNEASGTDASLQLAYQLAAGTDEATKKLLDKLGIAEELPEEISVRSARTDKEIEGHIGQYYSEGDLMGIVGPDAVVWVTPSTPGKLAALKKANYKYASGRFIIPHCSESSDDVQWLEMNLPEGEQERSRQDLQQPYRDAPARLPCTRQLPSHAPLHQQGD